MPVPVKYNCIQCGGETDIESSECIACQFTRHIKAVYQTKHVYYSNK